MVICLVRSKSPARFRLVAGAALLYPIVLAIASGWNPFMGRVLVPMVALGAPLFALLALKAGLRTVTIVLAVITLVPSVLANRQKPLLVPNGGPQPVFRQDRLAQQTTIRPEMAGVIRAVNDAIGPTAPLGFAGTEDAWDYPFFGARLERRVVRLDPKTVTRETMRENDVEAVLFAAAGPPPPALGAAEIGPDYYLARP